ncbi:MAG: hypothetical protein GY769_18970 [bacterium]|nr:hypothetical protein [bacterium]
MPASAVQFGWAPSLILVLHHDRCARKHRKILLLISVAGYSDDQFRPQAVVEVARNVYVAFQDTTDGQRVFFARAE